MSGALFSQDRELESALPLVEDCLRHSVRRLRTRMLTRSGMDTPVRLLSVRLCSGTELLEEPEVQGGVAWSGFFVERGGVSGFAVLEGALLERLTARLFGDSGSPVGAGYFNRSATDVELRVASRMCEELFQAIEAFWPVRPGPRLVARPATANRHGIADTTVAGAVIACTLECGSEEEPFGRLTIALPAPLLRGVAAVVDVPAMARSAERRASNFDRLLGCEVEMVVELTRLQTTLGTLRALRVGDELTLGPLAEVRAMVNGHPSFSGEPGACDGVRSFRVGRRVLSITQNA